MESKNLKRTLTLFPCIMIVVSSVIGSGIFTVPGQIMAVAKGSGPNFLAWIIAGICAFLMANVYIELAPAMPQAGGAYVYLRKAFGDQVAFFYGWGKMVNEVAVMALFSLAITNYLSFFFTLTSIQAKIIGTILLLFGATVSIRGTKQGAFVTTSFTIGKLLGIGLVIVGGVFAIRFANFQPVVDTSAGWSTSFSAAVPAFFAFGGYYQLCNMSEEIKDPKKTLPKALLIGISIIVGVYMLLTFVCVGVLGVEQLANSDKSVALAAQTIFGNIGGSIVAICAIVSIFGSLNSMMMSTPRVGFSMGRDGVFLSVFGKAHQKYGTPYIATICYCAFSVILLWMGNFTTLLMMCVFIARIMDALIAISLAVLRKRQPDMERPIKMKGYPVTLILVTALTIFLAAQVPGKQILFSLLLCAIGIPVYFISSLVNKKTTKV